VESRASTRLGEIVKLLTYVSIFYLPLTFSTVSRNYPRIVKLCFLHKKSLWSTTEQIHNLDTAILFGVMIALGAVTYTVVFNLNNLTRAVYRQYEAAKKPWIRRMKEERRGVWNTRAERYSGFTIKRFDTSPSEWLVIWYIITWPLRRCLGSRTLYTAEDQSVPKQSTEMPEKGTGTDDANDDAWLKGHPPFPDLDDGKRLHLPLS
jgi:hypothetical protein